MIVTWVAGTRVPVLFNGAAVDESTVPLAPARIGLLDWMEEADKLPASNALSVASSLAFVAVRPWIAASSSEVGTPSPAVVDAGECDTSRSCSSILAATLLSWDGNSFESASFLATRVLFLFEVACLHRSWIVPCQYVVALNARKHTAAGVSASAEPHALVRTPLPSYISPTPYQRDRHASDRKEIEANSDAEEKGYGGQIRLGEQEHAYVEDNCEEALGVADSGIKDLGESLKEWLFHLVKDDNDDRHECDEGHQRELQHAGQQGLMGHMTRSRWMKCFAE